LAIRNKLFNKFLTDLGLFLTTVARFLVHVYGVTSVKINGPRYQFYFSEIDVHVLVENDSEGVVVRASSRNVSERRKAFFIRYLAVEGHIPDQYQWFAGTPSDRFSHVRWIVDVSWLTIPPAVTRRTTRFMRRLFIGASLGWLASVILIFLQTR
jgi:hypothetical protein